MAFGLWPRVQRYPLQGELADGRQRAQRGRAELRVPIPATHIPQDPGTINCPP